MLSPAWLAARWANRIEKVEKVRKRLVAFGLLSAAWLAARWANRIEKVEKVGKRLVFVGFQR